MTIIVCVQVSDLKIRNSFDEVWLFLWQHIKACVIIIMISLTDFRFVFIANWTQTRNNNAKSKYSLKFKKLWSCKTFKSNDYDMKQRLSIISSMILSSMQIFIQDDKESFLFTLKFKDNIFEDWNRLKDVNHIQIFHILSQSALKCDA